MMKGTQMEIWMIFPLNPISAKGATSGQVYILKGFHTRTKECRHEYGPFLSMEELKEFAGVNQIFLSE